MAIDNVMNKGRAAEILLVEDNLGDVLLTRKAFKNAGIANHITVAEDGNTALTMLRREGEYHSHPLPDMILLDLNLPKKSGKDVLKEIKTDDSLKRIPVIVLTSSRAEIDVVKSYNLHANSYIVKPVSLEKFSEMLKSLEQFWFVVTVMPDESDIR
jgi:chemotaxis family two-component system response regulator Rcp1